MNVRQVYPNYGHTLHPQYYQQAYQAFIDGYHHRCVDGHYITLLGGCVFVALATEGGNKAVGIFDVNHTLRAIHPRLLAYDSSIGGNEQDCFYLIAKAICQLNYPIISDPSIGPGRQEFWNVYLTRCSEDEVSLLTISDDNNIIDVIPWSNVRNLQECNGNKVLCVNWGYTKRNRMVEITY